MTPFEPMLCKGLRFFEKFFLRVPKLFDLGSEGRIARHGWLHLLKNIQQ